MESFSHIQVEPPPTPPKQHRYLGTGRLLERWCQEMSDGVERVRQRRRKGKSELCRWADDNREQLGFNFFGGPSEELGMMQLRMLPYWLLILMIEGCLWGCRFFHTSGCTSACRLRKQPRLGEASRQKSWEPSCGGRQGRPWGMGGAPRHLQTHVTK